MRIAVIPARGGSKRIPGKNIKEFCGKPMIAWSIDAARDSCLFDRIIVSTDADEVADVARACGAEVPFSRPPELANDFVGTDGVFLHAIIEAERIGRPVDFACLILATAPLLRPERLRDGLEILKRSGACCASGVTTYPYPIQRALRVDPSGRLQLVWPEHANSRSQDLPHVVHEAGQFYWVDAQRFKANPDTFYDAVPVPLPRWSVQDIDTPEDWECAEQMFAAFRNPRATSNEEIT